MANTKNPTRNTPKKATAAKTTAPAAVSADTGNSKEITPAVTSDSTEPYVPEKKVVENKVEEKKKFKEGDYILCRSVTAGGLNISCRSGAHYEFKDYGYEEEIEYKDLVDLVRKHSTHVFNPRFIVVDKDFVEEFPQLGKLYASLYSVSDLKGVLKLEPEEMKAAISSLPEEVEPTLRSLAATMVGNGEIDSVRKIRALTEVFGADFELLSELFGGK